MTINSSLVKRSVAMLLMLTLTISSTYLRADSTGTCGGQMVGLPFNDVAGNPFFCQIAAAYFSGLTNGTSTTTFSPSDFVPREQMAAFITRTLDQSLKRGSRRAALGQFWTLQAVNDFGVTTVGPGPQHVKSDGADLWIANGADGTVSRVRASDGKLLETWTGAPAAFGVLVAMGRVFVTGVTSPGSIYMINPTQTAGTVSVLTNAVGDNPYGIAFDGGRIWTTNQTGSVSIATLNPFGITTVATGFIEPRGIVYDGSNMWITDVGDNTLKKLDSNGAILQSISVGMLPTYPIFDGTNIWIPNANSNTLSVVRVNNGTVLATLNGNGLSSGRQAAFDGERILVTNGIGNTVSLWKAADLTPLGFFSTPGTPNGVCSDGINFWFTLDNTGKLVRF